MKHAMNPATQTRSSETDLAECLRRCFFHLKELLDLLFDVGVDSARAIISKSLNKHALRDRLLPLLLSVSKHDRYHLQEL